MPNLSNISIVLVETQSAGNLGSVARVMMNMGLKKLILVDCLAELTDEAFQRACGADLLLRSACQVSGLRVALNPFHLSVATSSRFVRWFPTACSPRELASKLEVLSPSQKIAIIFGPERTGLTNEHLQHCQWQVRIPSDPSFASLNLAHAVAIVAYELGQGIDITPSERGLQLAARSQIESFSQDLENCLSEIQFLNKQNPQEVMMTLRQILARALLEDRDVRILRGILRQWGWYSRRIRDLQ